MEYTNELDVIKTDAGLIFNPYNPLNQQITEPEINQILRKHGLIYTVRNAALFQRAFVHRSYTKRPQHENDDNGITLSPRPSDCLELSTKSNERLEFLGDGVLEFITKLYLYKRFPKENEGFMTEKKIAVVKNETIGRIAMEMGLHKWLVISKHAEEKKTRTNHKKLGCLFEAFIGALFLDAENIRPLCEEDWTMDCDGPGFKCVKKFIVNILETYIDWVDLIQTDDNYKNILQVIIQKEFKVTPHYIEINVSDNGYQMGVFLCLGERIYDVDMCNAEDINNFSNFAEIHEKFTTHKKVFIHLGNGVHKIKRKSEQLACKCAIQTLQKFISEHECAEKQKLV